MISMEMGEALQALRCSDKYSLKGTGEKHILRELWKDRTRNATVESTMGVLLSDAFFRCIGARIGFAILNTFYVDLGA